MWVVRKYKTCNYCGAVGGMFYARTKLRKTGKRSFSLSSKCSCCHREDENLRQMRLFRLNKKRYGERAKKWRAENRKKYNLSQRVWYRKSVMVRNRYLPSDYGSYCYERSCR